jgi:hypothetical protein
MGSEWILGRLASRVWTGFDWLRIGTSGGLCCGECGDEPSGSCATELVTYITLRIFNHVRSIRNALSIPGSTFS